MGRLVGIDLGTTNSVVAFMDGPEPRVIDIESKPQMPSVVGLKRRRRAAAEPEILVGQVALEHWSMAPGDTIVSIKRLMGRGAGDPEVERVKRWAGYEIVQPREGTREGVRVLLGGVERSPTEVSAEILRKLKRGAEDVLKDVVTHAVITVPAYFSQVQRDATRRAGLAAGLSVIRLIDEPTAAALAFGLRQDETAEARTIVVYDLGGGTFDVSVLMLAGGVFAPLNLEGDMWLGGDDFDRKLIEHALSEFRGQYGVDPTGDATAMVKLKQAARLAKERLSASHSTDLIVPALLQHEGDNLDVDIEVTRKQLDEMIRPLVERTLEITEKALRHADLTVDAVDQVVMAGNATALTLVQDRLGAMFGADKLLRSVHPKHCVAMGAALLAAMLGPRVVCEAPSAGDPAKPCGHVNPSEVAACEKCGAPLGRPADPDAPDAKAEPPSIAAFPYGTQSAGDRFNVYIEKGEPYPTERPKTKVFRTRQAGQRLISVPMFAGEDLEHASANEKQGELLAVLPHGLAEGTGIQIQLWLDHDGVAQVAMHLENGTDLHPFEVQKGEAQTRVVEELEEADQIVAAQDDEQPLSAERRREIEEERERVLQRMVDHDFPNARTAVERLRAIAERPDRSPEPARPETSLRHVTGLAQMILQRFEWALDPAQTELLERLVRDARAVHRSTPDWEIEQYVQALEAALNDLPPVVTAIFQMEQMIKLIRDADQILAKDLDGELRAAEGELRSGEPGAVPRFNALFDRAEAAIAQLEPGGNRCAVCGHEKPLGYWKCPVCGDDERLPGAGGFSTGDVPGLGPGGTRCARGHEVPAGARYCPVPGCGDDLLGS